MCHSCQLICINEWRSLLWRTAEWYAKWQTGVASGRVNLLKDAADQTTIHAYWLRRQEDVFHCFYFFPVLAEADHELTVFSALTCRSDCIWMALLQCASWSVWWAHHFLQSATRSLPMNTCRVSHLEKYKSKDSSNSRNASVQVQMYFSWMLKILQETPETLRLLHALQPILLERSKHSQIRLRPEFEQGQFQGKTWSCAAAH